MPDIIARLNCSTMGALMATPAVAFAGWMLARTGASVAAGPVLDEELEQAESSATAAGRTRNIREWLDIADSPEEYITV